MGQDALSEERLDKIFPASKTDEFFDALYGVAEEGAYDIALRPRKIEDGKAELAFELRRREGKCLKCSLTYGLPEVFKRHPIINAAGLAKEVAGLIGWEGQPSWRIDPTREVNDDLHVSPFVVEKAS